MTTVSFEKQIEENKEKVRCGFCLNSITQSNKYHIVEIKDKEFNNEKVNGVLCDDCNQSKKEPKSALIFINKNMVSIPTNDLILLSTAKQPEAAEGSNNKSTKELNKETITEEYTPKPKK